MAGLALVPLIFIGCASVNDTSLSFRTVVIDAGHGGRDNGARSRYSPDEKHLALDVARRLEIRLRQRGVKTVMTRSADYFVELNERAAISNRQRSAVFVSVHFNHAGRKRYFHGTEVYYRSPASRALAIRILQQIQRECRSKANWVKTANFRVLKRNKYPAVLVECGYLSNPEEAKRCSSPKYRQQLAEAIAGALTGQKSGGRSSATHASTQTDMIPTW